MKSNQISMIDESSKFTSILSTNPDNNDKSSYLQKMMKSKSLTIRYDATYSFCFIFVIITSILLFLISFLDSNNIIVKYLTIALKAINITASGIIVFRQIWLRPRIVISPYDTEIEEKIKEKPILGNFIKRMTTYTGDIMQSNAN